MTTGAPTPAPETFRMDDIGAAIIGAGVIGLACARELARRGIDTLILEQHPVFGSETSARNSEVIHAGLYYPQDTLKAALCIDGRRRLYDYCASHGIAHQRCGKLVVATSAAQDAKLEALRDQAQANGVEDIRWLSARDARALEPELRCHAALLSPATGIVDSHGLMLALFGDAERAGATLARCAPVRSGTIGTHGVELAIGGDEPVRLRAARVINAAGLWARHVAATFEGFPARHLPPLHFAKGNYYSLGGRAPFSRLIYPLPEAGGLGVHLTLDLGGQARFGPDVEWLETLGDPPDYRVDPARAATFQDEVRRYWPALPDGALTPAYAGIRPKLSGPGKNTADFLLQGPETHGIANLVNLFGIESPGLTASLAIAARVADMLEQ